MIVQLHLKHPKLHLRRMIARWHSSRAGFALEWLSTHWGPWKRSLEHLYFYSVPCLNRYPTLCFSKPSLYSAMVESASSSSGRILLSNITERSKIWTATGENVSKQTTHTLSDVPKTFPELCSERSLQFCRSLLLQWISFDVLIQYSREIAMLVLTSIASNSVEILSSRICTLPPTKLTCSLHFLISISLVIAGTLVILCRESISSLSASMIQSSALQWSFASISFIWNLSSRVYSPSTAAQRYPLRCELH